MCHYLEGSIVQLSQKKEKKKEKKTLDRLWIGIE